LQSIPNHYAVKVDSEDCAKQFLGYYIVDGVLKATRRKSGIVAGTGILYMSQYTKSDLKPHITSHSTISN
jgi:hypothetical protein